MKTWRAVLAGVAALVAIGGCGGKGGTGPGVVGQVSGNFRATIDGAQWTADLSTITITGGAAGDVSAPVTISGSQISGGLSMSLALRYVGGPGTYPLGVNASNAGGTGALVRTTGTSSTLLMTPLSGAAGTLTITARTNTRIAGSFTYTAANTPGMPAAQANVTNGSFDLTMNGGRTIPSLPTDSGSVVAATLNGANWNAATIVTVGGAVGFGASTTDYNLTLLAIANITAPGTYAVPTQFAPALTRLGTTQRWGGGTGGGDAGTVTITSLTAGRLVGTFSMTLGAVAGSGATGTTTLANGRFNVKR